MADDADFGEMGGVEHPGELVFEKKFKGHPILVMRKTEADKYPFSIGMGKIRLILDNIQAIEAFAEKHSGDKD